MNTTTGDTYTYSYSNKLAELEKELSDLKRELEILKKIREVEDEIKKIKESLSPYSPYTYTISDSMPFYQNSFNT